MSEELNNKNEVENGVSNEDLINSLGLVDSKKDQEKGTSKNIQDININNLDDVLVLLDKNAYDFVTIEPNDSEVALNFRKNDVIIETKYIKFHVYSNILLKAKTITKLKVIDVTDIEQE
jgi:type II secretory ATPase GspE/PulE/Tfp pilus assembly ATPase PilB-like protein